MKKSKRVRDRIYRISFKGKDGIFREPARKFETYRRIFVDGVKKKVPQCFATIEEAESYRDSGGISITSPKKGMLLKEAVEKWKLAHFPHLEETSKDNILKVFPNESERKNRVYPCDFLMNDEVDSITPTRIDEWLAFIKSPEFLATQKKTKLSYILEYKNLSQALDYYATRINREYRKPFLKDHRKKIKIKDPSPKEKKDLPANKLGQFFFHIEEYCAGGPYAYVMAKLAEAQYRTYSRLQEAAAIHLEDTDAYSNRTVLNKRIQYLRRGKQKAILKDGHKKNGGRIIRSAEVTRLLLEVAKVRRIKSGPLFYVEGKPIPYKAIQNAYDYAHRKAETGQTATHVLRHGSLTEFQEASGDMNQTQKVAGHADIQTTGKYAGVRSSVINKAQEKVEEILRSTLGR